MSSLLSELQQERRLAGAMIGQLASLEGFSNVSQVIYLVSKEAEKSRPDYFRKNACLIVGIQGDVFLELSERTDTFWRYWESRTFDLYNLSNIIEEVVFFFETGEPKGTVLFEFRDGAKNERLHRVMRAEQKCNQLNSLFGFNLLAAEG